MPGAGRSPARTPSSGTPLTGSPREPQFAYRRPAAAQEEGHSSPLRPPHGTAGAFDLNGPPAPADPGPLPLRSEAQPSPPASDGTPPTVAPAAEVQPGEKQQRARGAAAAQPAPSEDEGGVGGLRPSGAPVSQHADAAAEGPRSVGGASAASGAAAAPLGGGAGGAAAWRGDDAAGRVSVSSAAAALGVPSRTSSACSAAATMLPDAVTQARPRRCPPLAAVCCRERREYREC